MEFTYTREQQMVKKMLREFAEKEIAPIASEIDEKAIYPYETIGKLAKLGLMGHGRFLRNTEEREQTT